MFLNRVGGAVWEMAVSVSKTGHRGGDQDVLWISTIQHRLASDKTVSGRQNGAS